MLMFYKPISTWHSYPNDGCVNMTVHTSPKHYVKA